MVDFGRRRRLELIRGADWPLWAVILERALTLLVLAALGIHAFVQYRRRDKKMATPQRWVFLSFAVALGCTAAVNFAMILLALGLTIKRGPFNTGMLSLTMFILYIIYIGISSNRRPRSL